MKKYNALVTIGIVTALIPFLGVPSMWKYFFTFASGVSVTIITILLRRSLRAHLQDGKKNDAPSYARTYIENTEGGFMGIIVMLVVALILAGGIYFVVNPIKPIGPGGTEDRNPGPSITPTPTVTATITPTPTPTVSADTMQVKIALLRNLTGNESGVKKAGCDQIVYKTINVPKSNAPLNAALTALFADTTKWPPATDVEGNFIATQKNLAYKNVTLENGTARVYLTGSQSLGGICDDPRLEAQIDNTALQFPTVKSVEIYINGVGIYSDESGTKPIITSITPSSGPVGTIVTLKGRNLAGFEGDLDAWIENAAHERAYLPPYSTVYPRTDQITVKIPVKACKQNNSYSGNDCTAYVNITPGTYTLYSIPWNAKTNLVSFTVTAQ